MDLFKDFWMKRSKEELVETLRILFREENELKDLISEALQYPRDDGNGPYQGGFINGHLELEDLVKELIAEHNELYNQK